MKRLLFFILLSLSIHSLHAQIVSVTDQVKVKIKKRSKQFNAIHPDLPKDSLIYIATIEGQAKKLKILYSFLKSETHELKGNFYEMEQATFENGKHHVTWKIYYGSDTLGIINHNLYPKNEVFFFSTFTTEKRFRIHGELLTLPKFSYSKIMLTESDTLKFSFGSSSIKTKSRILGSHKNASIYLGETEQTMSLSKLIIPSISAVILGEIGVLGYWMIYDLNKKFILQPGDGYFLQQIFTEIPIQELKSGY